MDPQVEAAVVELALELPAHGQIRIANEVLKRHVLSVSPQGVRSIWLRHDLETMNKRLKALNLRKARDPACDTTWNGREPVSIEGHSRKQFDP
ncbi:hypothetical protein GGD68_002700 [Paraburkholderia fungorum]|uniref:Transposase n=1 Tax=Paraburkholderia fungorum TaxID=134537 RepID=A0AAW3UUG0_9BURK|nr:hypothetical protein [Paraburkholderia fungorum]MBB6201180.1 hypothetical protein [Paraburkholderia fungorum]